MTKLIIATHNAHKLKEFQAGFVGTDFILTSATDHGIGDIPETGSTFHENALLKAQTVTDITGLAAMGDDSGVIVTELRAEYGEFPGLYTKRFTEEMGGYDQAVQEIMRRLNGRPAKAYYQCTLALTQPGKEPLIVDGTVHGTLVYPNRGDGHFGYDPWFMPDGLDRTFGEVTLDEKRALDHRTNALNKMLALLAKA
ncbi:MAG TPA: non-canonical purine NTP pyrophosphatase [Alphaproteobacteria bacterium]